MRRSIAVLFVVLVLCGTSAASPKRAKRTSRATKVKMVVVTNVVTTNPQMYKMTDIAGLSLPGLFSIYFGSNFATPEMSIDYKNQMALLWDRKFLRSRNRSDVVGVGKKFVESYMPPREAERITLQQYLSRVDVKLQPIKRELDWGCVRRLKQLNASEEQMLRRQASFVDARLLTAIALAELSPLPNGERNVKIFATLINQAGPEFVYRIPAIGDNQVSFGAYQFTHYAHDGTLDEPIGSALLSRCLPKPLQLPPTVAEVQGELQHVAAFLYAVNNIADFIQSASTGQLRAFQTSKISEDSFPYWIGMAHHDPGPLIRYGKEWLDSGAEQSILSVVSGRFPLYGQKVRENYLALRRIYAPSISQSGRLPLCLAP